MWHLTLALANTGEISGRFVVGAVILLAVDTANPYRLALASEVIAILTAKCDMPKHIASPCRCRSFLFADIEQIFLWGIRAEFENFQRTTLIVGNVGHVRGLVFGAIACPSALPTN